MSTNRTFRTSDSEALSEVRQHHSIGRTSGNAANVAPRRRPSVENYRTSCNRLKHACWISGQAFMSSYYPSSAHHSSAACPSTRRSSTSRQDSSAAPVRYKANTSPPQVLWSRTTRLQWTRDTFCTIGHKRVFKAGGSAHQPDRGPPKRDRVPPDRCRTTRCAHSSSNSGHP